MIKLINLLYETSNNEYNRYIVEIIDEETDDMYVEEFNTLKDATEFFDSLKDYDDVIFLTGNLIKDTTSYISIIDRKTDKIIKEKTIYYSNYESDKLLDEIQAHYHKIYGDYKYNLIDDFPSFVPIILRISNHTMNAFNTNVYSDDYIISVVIANKDKTEDRFKYNELSNNHIISLRFTSDNTKEEIIQKINKEIEKMKKLLIKKYPDDEYEYD